MTDGVSSLAPMTARRLSRRTVLVAGLAAAGGGLAACASGSKRRATSATTVTSIPAGSTSAAAPGAPPTSATTSPAVGGPAGFVSHGPTSTRQVALTLHMNGSDPVIDQMLDVLAKHHTAITAFVVGNWLDQNRAYAQRLLQGGHELANHTWTHPTFLKLGPAGMSEEIDRCRDVLRELTGGGGRWFRPSGTDNGVDIPSAAALLAAGTSGYQTVVGYDVDPADYQDPGAAVIVSRVLQAVGPGSIVSLHFGHAGTVEAMPDLLAGLDRARLRPVTLSTLLT